MTTELQNKAWSVLPKEFKEEVKKMYEVAQSYAMGDLEINARVCESVLLELFGHHNLTSEAEGEEMLMCNKGVVEALYLESLKCAPKLERWKGIKWTLDRLFGSKCLPDKVDSLKNKSRFEMGDVVVYHPFKTNSFYDAKLIEIKEGEDKPYLLQLGNKEEVWVYPIEVQSIAETYPPEQKKNRCERCGVPNSSICAHMNCQDYKTQTDPKPAEPKYHKGEKVRYNGYVYEVEDLVGRNRYALKGLNFDLDEDMIEPYNDPTEGTSPNVNDSDINIDELVAKGYVYDPAKGFANILNDSFRNERRLNIAAMIMGNIIQGGYYALAKKYRKENMREIVKLSLELTEALIEECEHTNKLKGE